MGAVGVQRKEVWTRPGLEEMQLTWTLKVDSIEGMLRERREIFRQWK